MSLPTDKLYYPIGNTPPADVTLGCHVDRQCDILLLGCGDIRNILFTLHNFKETGTQPTRGRQFNFHVNDNEVSILSRDLVLLQVISSIDPSQPEDMIFLWCVWFDVLLSTDHRHRLIGLINSLSKDKSGNEGVIFGNETTDTAVKNCLESWTTEERGTQEVVESRRLLQALNKSEYEITSSQRVASRYVCQYHIFQDERNKDRYEQEVEEYTEVGTTRINTSRMSQKQVLKAYLPNVTFLPPASTNWRVPSDSSPFMCFELENEMERYDGSKYTVAKASLEKLTQWVTSFKQLMKHCKINVTLWLDDARHLCEETLPVDLTFDFIDTSNLADSLGLVSLLVSCRDRLKGESGVMRMEVFDWFHCLGDGERYLRLCVDIPPPMYPTVLGLHLAEELHTGHEHYLEMGYFEGCSKLVLRWKKAGAFTPCTITDDDSVSSAIDVLKSLTNPQRIADFPRVNSSHCDERTRAKALSRMKEVTVKNVKGREKVIEYNDRYEIEIPTEQGDACALTVTTGNIDKRLVIFQLSTGGVTKFKSELRFSCPVLIDKKKTWANKGLIKGTLLKDKANTVGERLLPWRKLTSKMISNMQDYPTSKYYETLLVIHSGWVFLTEDGSHAVDHEKPYPRHQLRDLVNVLMMDRFHMPDPKLFKEKMFCMPRKPPKGVSPLDVYKSTITLDTLKIYEDKPTLFLSVYDHDIGKSLLEDSHLSLMDLFGDLVEIKESRRIHEKLLEGYDMLIDILRVNSHRVQQDDSSCSWKMKSFLRMRYPFQHGGNFQLLTKCMAKFTEGGAWKSQSAQLEYLQMILDMAEKEPRSRRKDTLETLKASVGFFKPVCDSCGRMTDCKMCTACNKVYYCSRSCQRRAWPQHKVYCSK